MENQIVWQDGFRANLVVKVFLSHLRLLHQEWIVGLSCRLSRGRRISIQFNYQDPIQLLLHFDIEQQRAGQNHARVSFMVLDQAIWDQDLIDQHR